MEKKLPEKKWYSIADLVKRWGRTKKEIEGFILTRALEATTRQGIVNPDDTAIYEQNAYYIAHLLRGLSGSYPPGTQLIILPTEVERFETENLETVASFGKEAPYLDPEHEFYAPELAIAVKAWLAVYGGAGKYKANKANKQQIIDYLEGCGVQGETLRKRIATVANPNKDGGAPRSGPKKKQ